MDSARAKGGSLSWTIFRNWLIQQVNRQERRYTDVAIGGIRAHLSAVSGGRIGVRARDIESRYRLPRFARCAVCGGGLCVMTRSHGKPGERVGFYGCLAHHKRGGAVCENRLTVRMERVNEAVLGTLASDVLRPAVIDAVVAGVLDGLKPAARSRDVERRRAELAEVEAELARLTEAIATGGALAPLLAALQVRQQRRDTLATELAAFQATGPIKVNQRAIEAQVRERLTAWRALLTEQVEDGRELLRQVLAGPLRFTPEGSRYRFEGEAAIGRLLSGTVGLATNVASPPGTETLCTLEITADVPAA